MTNDSGRKGEQEEIILDLVDLESRISLARDAYKKGGEYVEEALFHLIRSRGEALDLIKQIGYPRYQPVKTTSIYEPEPTLDSLRTCPFCGNPNCQSDHK
jgi:hypothetical protein